MIIPIRCFTCGNIIASKYKKYLELMNSKELILRKGVILVKKTSTNVLATDKVFSLKSRKDHITDFMSALDNKFKTGEKLNIEKPIEGLIMKQLGLKRYCCKRHLICHVDILDKL